MTYSVIQVDAGVWAVKTGEDERGQALYLPKTETDDKREAERMAARYNGEEA